MCVYIYIYVIIYIYIYTHICYTHIISKEVSLLGVLAPEELSGAGLGDRKACRAVSISVIVSSISTTITLLLLLLLLLILLLLLLPSRLVLPTSGVGPSV